MPLAVRRGAGDDLDRTGRQTADRRRVPAAGRVADGAQYARRGQPAHLVVRREADAEQAHVAAVPPALLLRAQRRVVERLDELVQRRVIVPRVDRQTGRDRLRELRDEVAATQLHRVDPELSRQRVHRALDGHRRLGPTGSAVGVGRRRVREHPGAREAVGRDVVRTRVQPGAEQGNPRRHELQIGAHGGGQVGPDSGDLAVGVRRVLHLLDDVAAVDGGEVSLRPLLGPLDGTSEPPCQREREQLLGVDVQLRAKAAADVGRDDAELRLGHADRGRCEQSQDVRDLGRSPDRRLAGRGIGLHHDPSRLHRVRDQTRVVVALLDRRGRVRERCVDFSGLELPDVADVGAELVVDQRCAVLRRRLDVHRCGQRLVVHLDELRRVLRAGARLGDDHGHAVALVPRLFGRERKVRAVLHVLRHRPGAGQTGLPVVCEIGAGERGDDALRGARRGNVDALHPGVRVRAADDGHPDHARERDVVDVRSAPPEQGRVLLALDARADVLRRLGLGGGAHDVTPAAAATALTMLW